MEALKLVLKTNNSIFNYEYILQILEIALGTTVTSTYAATPVMGYL